MARRLTRWARVWRRHAWADGGWGGGLHAAASRSHHLLPLRGGALIGMVLRMDRPAAGRHPTCRFDKERWRAPVCCDTSSGVDRNVGDSGHSGDGGGGGGLWGASSSGAGGGGGGGGGAGGGF